VSILAVREFYAIVYWTMVSQASFTFSFVSALAEIFNI